MADELGRRLEALGEVETPPLDADRLAAISERVMAATAHPAETTDRRRGLVLAVAAGLIALLIAGVVLAAARGGDDTHLEFADRVTLELPDATPEIGSAGDSLPDGTVVSVANGGTAVVDGRRFGPGRYLVVDGEIVPLDLEAATTTTTTTTPAAEPTEQRPPGTVPEPPTPSRTTTTIPSGDTVDRPSPDGTLPPRPPTARPTTTLRAGVDRSTTVADRPTTTLPRPSTTTTVAQPTTTVQRDRVATTSTTISTTISTTTTVVRDRSPSDGP